MIRTKRAVNLLPILETILDGGRREPAIPANRPAVPLATTESKGIKDANEQPSETQAPPVFAGADLFD